MSVKFLHLCVDRGRPQGAPPIIRSAPTLTMNGLPCPLVVVVSERPGRLSMQKSDAYPDRWLSILAGNWLVTIGTWVMKCPGIWDRDILIGLVLRGLVHLI